MITDSALLLRLQTEILEAVACGESLTAIAELLCLRVEAAVPDVTCSILAVDAEGYLHPLAAPSLPVNFGAAVDGAPIGPKAGSCGTAAFRNEAVMVTDIASDPLWEDFRGLALPLGLRACWSSPIRDSADNVVATFAFYYRSCRGPDELERSIVQTCVHLCAIAIEHERVRLKNHRLAYFDALTNLPNRGHFNDLLASHIKRGKPFGLLLADIDHLKVVNDTLGHTYGDILIRTIAERIAGSAPGLVACRLGGDEFAVIVPGCADERSLSSAAAHMLSCVRGLIVVGEQTLDPHVTAGGALFGPDGADAATLSQSADFALYHAKETRRGSYVRFAPGLRTSMIQRASMVRAVDQAITEKRIIAHYQPLVRIDTGEIVGLEALARMRMPDGRIAAAGEFYAAMADARIAYQLTGEMLTQVAADIRHWLDLGIDFQHVGINVTSGDFLRGDLEQRIVSTFEAAGVPLKHIVLEVNEAVFMGGNDNKVPRAVSALRQRGLLVALDDFGTGFASLTHLLTFPVDIIKVDKSFIERLVHDTSSKVIVGAIIDIARKLDMRIIAEGIESAEQVDALRALGCSLGQGYLFARPCSAKDTTELLSVFAQKPKPSAETRLFA